MYMALSGMYFWTFMTENVLQLKHMSNMSNFNSKLQAFL